MQKPGVIRFGVLSVSGLPTASKVHWAQGPERLENRHYHIFQTIRPTSPKLGGNGGVSYSLNIAYLARFQGDWRGAKVE